MAPHQLVIAADAARRDDDRLRAQRERADQAGASLRCRAPRCSAPARRPARRRSTPPVLVSAVTRWRKRNETSPRLSRLAHAAHERLDHARPGAPGDVKARHRIAVAGRQIAAALGPADDRKNPQALLRAARRASRPRRNPHRPRPSGAASDPRRGRSRPSRASPAARDRGESRMRRRRCSGESTKNNPPNDQNACPPSEPSRLLIENDDAPARIGEFGGGDEARKPRADHDGVCVHSVPPTAGQGMDVRRFASGKTARDGHIACCRPCPTRSVLSVVPKFETVPRWWRRRRRRSGHIRSRSRRLSSARKRRTSLPNERTTTHQPRPLLRGPKVQSSVVRCATSGTSAGGIGYSRSRFGRTQASLGLPSRSPFRPSAGTHRAASRDGNPDRCGSRR